MNTRSELLNEKLPNLILNIFIAYGASSMLEDGFDFDEVLDDVKRKIIDMSTIYATNYEELFKKGTIENKKNLRTYKEI